MLTHFMQAKKFETRIAARQAPLLTGDARLEFLLGAWKCVSALSARASMLSSYQPTSPARASMFDVAFAKRCLAREAARQLPPHYTGAAIFIQWYNVYLFIEYENGP